MQESKKALGLAVGSILLVGAGCAPATNDNTVPPSAEGDTGAGATMPVGSETPDNGMVGGDAAVGTPKYKDGTYSAVGNYTYHSGPESITLGVTLKNDIIVDTTYEAKANVAPSEKFMKLFGDNYKVLVVGKNIDEVHLDKVSGSSRTPIGFNDAIAKIKAEAAIQ